MSLVSVLLAVSTLIGFPLVEQHAAAQGKGGVPEQGATGGQQRQEEMTHRTFEQQIDLLQKEQKGLLPPKVLEESSEEKSESGTGTRRFLGIAWEYCNRGDYLRAIEIFTTLSSDPATQWEAKYGLAMCYTRSKDAKKAIPLLEELITRKLHLKDTLPTLLAFLVKGKDYGKAATYVQLLVGRERERWEEIIRTGTLLAALAQAKAAGNLEGLFELIRTHSDLLVRCQSPEVFFEAANGLVGINDQYAKETYTRLLRACPRKWDIRLGILYALKSVLPPADTLVELTHEEGRTDLEPKYRGQLIDIRIAVFQDQIAAAPPDAPEIERLAATILTLRPEDRGALTSLAWWYFNRGQYEKAAQGFTTLARRDPKDLNASYGLANVLMKLKRVDEALAFIEPLKVRDARFVALETDILMERALTVFNERRYAEAERSFESLLARRPEHLDTKRLLAWSIYNQKRENDALPLFLSLFHAQEDPSIASTILDIYTTSRDRKRAAAFAEDLALSETQKLKKVAGDFYFKSGYPVRAAATYCDPDTCYYNANTPLAEASNYYRHRTGTEGLSRLTEYTIPLGFSYIVQPGTEVGLSLTTHHLSSGDVPPNSPIGSVFRRTPQKHVFTTSASVVTPEIRLVKESLEMSYSLALGTTSLGGPTAPLPTFSGHIRDKDWNLNIHQSSVRESVLSSIGAQDPFSDKTWGRVVRTGIDGEWIATQLAPYWLSLKSGYDFYHGERVIDNHAYRASIAAGRTLTAERWAISPGVLLYAQHFAHSTDFFTFGHGGYFSPDTHYILGPFVNLQTQQCNTFIVEGQFGVNYFHAKSNSAPVDPLGRSVPERFSGSSSSGLGFAMNLKGQILLGNHWALGGTAEANKAADFTEVKAGINLQYFFEPRSKLLHRDGIFR